MKETKVTHHVENLIVGFGFSSIPLLRELERRGQPYTILSSGKPLWQQLKESDKLDFDLVSSFHSSLLTEDQVKDGTLQDYFPTATQFYEYQERIFPEFRDKVVTTKVTLVENYTSYSLVHTDSGAVYKAENVVFATGLGRPQNQIIKDLDVGSIKNKTVVVAMSGDTGNMMLAKLIPNGNKCIVLSNGYVVLDKIVVFDAPGPKDSNWFIPLGGFRTGKQYRIDLAQAESHTLYDVFPKMYKQLYNVAFGSPGPGSWEAKIIWPDTFFNRYSQTYRRDLCDSNMECEGGLRNGLLGIKYHSIDIYKTAFGGEDLEKNISEGVLLNDICFWHTEGLAESWSKHSSSLDLENKTIRSEDGRTVSFDYFIEGGYETPNLPPIVSVSDDGTTRHKYSYRYRSSYLGSVPANLRNIFFIGFTRPTTGGIVNMNEMQALLIHKLLSTPKKKAQLYSEIHERLRTYNNKYYVEQYKDYPSDHLVSFGLYTREVAKYLGIERPILRTAFSLNPVKFFMNLRFELLFANNALKYRMEGEYKLQGAEKYARDVFAFNEHNGLVFYLFSCLLWDRLLVWLSLGMLAWQYSIEPFLKLNAICSFENVECRAGEAFQNMLLHSTTIAVLLYIVFVTIERKMMLLFLQTYSLPMPALGLKAGLQPIAMAYTAWAGEWYWCLAIFGFFTIVAFLGRQIHAYPFSGRYMFGDCKYKYKYRPFWKEYKKAFDKVQAAKQKQKNVM